LIYATCITSWGAKNTTAVGMLLLKFKVTCSISFLHCSIVLCRRQKPNWLLLSRSLISVWLWTIFRIIFLKSLPVVDKWLIRLKLFESSPGFSKVMIIASFKYFGKCDNRRQWLNKCVKFTSCLFGRFLKRSFGIPSIPHAFLSFSDFINFYISQGVTFSKGVLSAASRSAWSVASTHCLWFPSHKSCGVNWFSKCSAVLVAFSRGSYFKS
jgi:hypothetical protein